jgi:hypothetical protein
MALYRAVTQRRLGELVGGDEGRAMIESATDQLVRGRVVAPASLTAMLAPAW